MLSSALRYSQRHSSFRSFGVKIRLVATEQAAIIHCSADYVFGGHGCNHLIAHESAALRLIDCATQALERLRRGEAAYGQCKVVAGGKTCLCELTEFVTLAQALL